MVVESLLLLLVVESLTLLLVVVVISFMLQLKINTRCLPLLTCKVKLHLQFRITTTIVDICDANMSLLIIIIIKIILLEASVSLVLAEKNIITFD